MKTIAIIPAFNEEKTIKGIVEGTRKYVDNILVIDDGSSDGTSKLNQCVVIKNKKNLGKGASLFKGFKYAIQNKFDAVITIDGDGEHNPQDIPLFTSALEESDLVVGQRNMQRSIQRSLLNKFSTFWVKMILGELYDTQCGFRAIRIDLLKKMNLSQKRFELEMEMLLEAKKHKAKIVPVQIENNAILQSNVTIKDYLMINNVFDEWIIRNCKHLDINMFQQITLKIFAHLGLFFGKIGLRIVGG